MQQLEKRITGLSFRKSDTVAEGLAQFVREVMETSGVALGDQDNAVLDRVRAITEVLVRAGAFQGLRIDMDIARVELKADYWNIDEDDDRDVQLLRFIKKVPDSVTVTILASADNSYLGWLGVSAQDNNPSGRLTVKIEQTAKPNKEGTNDDNKPD